MRCEIEYSTRCVISVRDRLGYSWEYTQVYTKLKDALKDCARIIDDEETIWKRDDIECVYVTDADTGELLAECGPDPWVDEDDSDAYPDWDYNEDMGFDPYLGCYSDDC